MEKGARTRRLYLPAGRWREWHEDTDVDIPGRDGIVQGGCWVTVDAPLEKLPVFIRVDTV